MEIDVARDPDRGRVDPERKPLIAETAFVDPDLDTVACEWWEDTDDA